MLTRSEQKVQVLRELPVGAQLHLEVDERTRRGTRRLKRYYQKVADNRWQLNVGRDKWLVGTYSDATVAWKLDLARSEGRA